MLNTEHELLSNRRYDIEAGFHPKLSGQGDFTMTIETIRDILAWCSVINVALLFWWIMFFTFAHNWLYKLHSKWFRLSIETFDSIHYAGMAFFKLCLLVFNIVPYLAIRIIL